MANARLGSLMTFDLRTFGATEEVTGSLCVLRTDNHAILLECALVQSPVQRHG